MRAAAASCHSREQRAERLGPLDRPRWDRLLGTGHHLLSAQGGTRSSPTAGATAALGNIPPDKLVVIL